MSDEEKLKKSKEFYCGVALNYHNLKLHGALNSVVWMLQELESARKKNFELISSLRTKWNNINDLLSVNKNTFDLEDTKYVDTYYNKINEIMEYYNHLGNLLKLENTHKQRISQLIIWTDDIIDDLGDIREDLFLIKKDREMAK
jgi:hypothetical protein